ncbi:MAG TPA: hypothetical protein PKC18_06835 [Lacipirellulaceae bacterium]|nr:hypothetical protein [Lacipirellulaceae bacterium]
MTSCRGVSTFLRVLLGLAVTICLELPRDASAAAAELRTVALSGQPAPGADGAAVSSASALPFGAPSLNASGQTAFHAYLAGGGVTTANRSGIWSEGSGALGLVARQGSPAPGTPSGVNFSDLSGTAQSGGFVALNASGQIAFVAGLTGSGLSVNNSRGIWRGGADSLALVARAGSPAPGIGNPQFASFFTPPAMNDSGQVAFLASQSQVWVERAGIFSLVANAGAPAPGTESGVNFGTLGFLNRSPVLNSAGLSAFGGQLVGNGVNSSNNAGMWSEGSGSLSLLARGGSQPPGTESGVRFDAFFYVSVANTISTPVINAAGQSAFMAPLVGSGVNMSNNEGIWSDRSGELALVVRSGVQAPGSDGGITFAGFSTPVINAAGNLAFLAGHGATGAGLINWQGIWSDASGELALVAHRGSQAPDVPSGVNFNNFSDFTSSGTGHSLVLNSSGQLAFTAGVGGTGVNTTNNRGIWATDRSGHLRLIARMGDPLEVAPGDIRTISGLVFVGNSGNEDGRPSGFNDLGQLAFMARFTDGTSGVFVSNRVAVPEPSAAALVLCAAAGLNRRRRASC